MITAQITEIGDELGIILSAEALAEFGLGDGGELYLSRANDGSMRLSKGRAEGAS